MARVLAVFALSNRHNRRRRRAGREEDCVVRRLHPRQHERRQPEDEGRPATRRRRHRSARGVQVADRRTPVAATSSSSARRARTPTTRSSRRSRRRTRSRRLSFTTARPPPIRPCSSASSTPRPCSWQVAIKATTSSTGKTRRSKTRSTRWPGAACRLAVQAPVWRCSASFRSRRSTTASRRTRRSPIRYSSKITIERDFLDLPYLKGIITDTHFVERNRLGRTLVFLARMLQDGMASPARAIAVDSTTAVLVESDGTASVVGKTTAYFPDGDEARHCLPGQHAALD